MDNMSPRRQWISAIPMSNLLKPRAGGMAVSALLSAVLVGLAACSQSDSSTIPVAAEHKELVRRSDARLRDTTGIGIYAIGLLAQADSDVFLLESALTSRQQAALQALAKHGYIELQRVDAEDGVYVTYAPTAKGRNLVDALPEGKP